MTTTYEVPQVTDTSEYDFTTSDDRPCSSASMAPRTWRLQEFSFLLAIGDTDEGRKLLAKAQAANTDEWWLHCRNYWVRKYLDTFAAAFPEESEAEFEQRQKMQPRAKTLTRFSAETEADRQHRLDRIRQVSTSPAYTMLPRVTLVQRIGTYLRTLSPNRARRTKSPKQRKQASHATQGHLSQTQTLLPVFAASDTPLAAPASPARTASNHTAATHAREVPDIRTREEYAQAVKALELAIHEFAVFPAVSREE